MSRENRGLLINFGILLVVSISFILGYGILYKNLDKKDALKEYQVYFSEATDFTEVSVDSTIISKKVEIKKGSDVIGYYFVGSEYAEGIPGHDGKDELRISVVVDKSGKFINIQTEYSEHTESFVSKLNTFYSNAKNQNIADFKNIDGEAGASAYSMPVVEKVLTEIAKNLSITVKPMVPKDPYILVFGNYERKELDTEFVADDVLLSRELIYNDLNQVIGIAYVGTGKAVLHDYDETLKTFNLIVGLDIEGNFVGFAPYEHEHTTSYVDRLNPYFDRLLDVNVDAYEGVDVVVSPTAARTMSVVQSILAKVKERFEGFDVYAHVSNGYVTIEDDVTFVATDKVLEKKVLKDSEGLVTGYVYVGTDGITGIPGHDGKDYIKLAVGVDLTGNITGVYLIESAHTEGFVKRIIPYLNTLEGQAIASYKTTYNNGTSEVDGFAGASEYTKPVIISILNAIKGVA